MTTLLNLIVCTCGSIHPGRVKLAAPIELNMPPRARRPCARPSPSPFSITRSRKRNLSALIVDANVFSWPLVH